MASLLLAQGVILVAKSAKNNNIHHLLNSYNFTDYAFEKTMLIEIAA